MKLNLGCGYNHISGYVNADCQPEVTPDQLVDLESFPWPWPNNSVAEIRLHHVLEHLGETTETYKRIIQEMYRVSQPGTTISIVVPFHRHENFWADPTHVRVITPLGLSMLSKKNNKIWIENHYANTPIANYWNVDFQLVALMYVSDAVTWKQVFPALPRDDCKLENQNKLAEFSHLNNLVSEIHFTFIVVKEQK